MNGDLKVSNSTPPGAHNSGTNSPSCEVVVIGSGPYGLSAGAHLKAAGIDVRVFGRPMEFWDKKMPAGMLLRSPRPASNISDPVDAFTLDAFENAAGMQPAVRIPLETFVGYGKWFQRQLLPELDTREVAQIEITNDGFRSVLEDGTSIRSKRVVVATGIGPFQRIPDEFKSLPPSQLTHCYSGFDVQSFQRKKVVVIGAGQSALESAALLHEAGAEVEIITRQPFLRWIGQHPWLHNLGPISQMLYSKHDIGPAGISRLVAYPHVVKHFPLGFRDKFRKRAVRSAGSNWLPDRLKNVTVKTSRSVTESKSGGSQAQLKLTDGTTVSTDHVILGTGYAVDISRYSFLSPQLLQKVSVFDGYPRVKAGFESSVPGLHFIGATAARSFGPLLYFVTGTEFASNELASVIVRKSAVAR
jgi:FAD-dependent urate hydroxylase